MNIKTFIDDAAKKGDRKWLQDRAKEVEREVQQAKNRIDDEESLISSLQGELSYIKEKLNCIE